MIKKKFLSTVMLSTSLVCTLNLNSFSMNNGRGGSYPNNLRGPEKREKRQRRNKPVVRKGNFEQCGEGVDGDCDKVNVYASEDASGDADENVVTRNSQTFYNSSVDISNPLSDNFSFNKHIRGASGKPLREGSHIDLFRRASYVKRWHNLKSSEEKTLVQHLFNTATLAFDLAVVRNALIENDEIQKNSREYPYLDPYFVAFVALLHDWPEIYTGDVLAPAKYYDKDMKQAYSKVEEGLQRDFFELIPRMNREFYTKVVNCDSHVKQIVKAADVIENYLTGLEEFSSGNHDFIEPCRILKAQIMKFAETMPEVEYYCEKILPIYESNRHARKGKPIRPVD